MDKNTIPRKKVIKTREERLKIALKSNMAKRKAQATAREHRIYPILKTLISN